jgi:putative FmdB family regulatory protein
MPTYEYECQKCRHRLEAFQSITAKPLSKCERCGGKLKRLLSEGSGFLFKGTGFYITDYRSKKYQDAKQKDQPAASPPAKAPSSDSKPSRDSKPA